MTNAGMQNIGIRLIGDAGPLTRTLDEGGKAVSDYARRAQQDLNRTGVVGEASAGQIQAAMRSLPAQFTDVFTSLAAGQAPMTVLLQQGGQIKDMFGGMGAAVRGVGQFMASLLTPTTAVVGALGLLSYAVINGAREQTAFNTAIALSGNSAGVTAGQLGDMARQVAATTGTVGSASAALADLVRSGSVARDNLVAFAGTAQQLEKLGVPIKDTTTALQQLAEKPLEASIKFNRQYNYLTESVYRQIKALEEQGRVLEAGRLAQEAFMNGMSAMTAGVTNQLGLLERAWAGVTGAAKRAWDAMLGIGRQESLGDRIASVRAQLADREQSLAQYGNRGGLFGATTAQQVQDLREQLNLLQEQERMMRRGAEATAERAASTKAAIEADQLVGRFLPDRVRMEQEIAAARKKLVEAGRSQADIELVINGIRDQYQKGGRTAADPDASLLRSAREMLAMLQAQGEATERLSQAEQARARYLAAISSGDRKYNVETDREVMRLYAEAIAAEKANEARATALKLAEAEAKIRERTEAMAMREVETQLRAVDSMIGSNEQLRDEIALIGLNAQQRAERLQVKERERIADLEERLITAQNVEGNEAMVASIQREIALRKQRLDLLADKGARETALEAIRADQQVYADIARSLTDNLMRGGKSFWQYMRDTARTTVLRPIIQGVMTAGVSAVGSMLGLSTPSAGAGGLPGAVANLGSMAGTIGSLASLGGATGAFGTGLMSGLSAWGAGGSVTGLLGTGSAIFSGGLASGLGTLAGALGPIAIGALVLSSLAKGGETRSGGIYSGLQKQTGPSGGEIAADQVQQLIASTISSTNNALAGLGSSARIGSLMSGLESSGKGRGFAGAGGYLTSGAAFGQSTDAAIRASRRGSMSQEAALVAFQEELKQATLQALQAADVPGQLGDYLRSLGNVDALSGGALDAALSRVQNAIAQRQALEARLFELTATDTQKLARTRDQERAATDATNQSLLDQVYLQEDLKAAADKAQQSISGLSQTLEQALSGFNTSAVGGLSVAEAFAQVQTALAVARAGGPLPTQASLGDAISVLSRGDNSMASSQMEYLAQRDAQANSLRELKALLDGTTTTPAVSAAQAAANDAATRQATADALVALNDQLAKANVELAKIRDESERQRALLDAVTTGNAALQTTPYVGY